MMIWGWYVDREVLAVAVAVVLVLGVVLRVVTYREPE